MTREDFEQYIILWTLKGHIQGTEKLARKSKTAIVKRIMIITQDYNIKLIYTEDEKTVDINGIELLTRKTGFTSNITTFGELIKMLQ